MSGLTIAMGYVIDIDGHPEFVSAAGLRHKVRREIARTWIGGVSVVVGGWFISPALTFDVACDIAASDLDGLS